MPEGPPEDRVDRIIISEQITAKAEEILDHVLWRVGGLPRSMDGSPGAATAILNFKTGISEALGKIERSQRNPSMQGEYSGYSPEDLDQLAAILRARANTMLTEALPGVMKRIRDDAEENIANLEKPF